MMMPYRIVSTDFDGKVRITCPAPEIHAVMTSGGGWFDRDGPYQELTGNANTLGVQGSMHREIEKQIRNGRNERVTRKFINALAFGGCTDAEFFEIIRDRDCAVWGTGCELWHVGEIPKDRWFRNAWRRSANGGPIAVDLEKAKLIQISRIEKRIGELTPKDGVLMRFLTPKFKKFRFNLRAMAAQIGEARDEYELRRIWPDAFMR